MKVYFEYEDTIIASADLSLLPREDDVISIFGTWYKITCVRHDIKIEQYDLEVNGKLECKTYTKELIICTLDKKDYTY